MERLKIQLLLAAVLFFSFSCKSTDPLFQENVDSWSVNGDADWKFLNKELIGTSEDEKGFVLTKNTYKDFILELEFRPDSTINSGVFIRCKNEAISATDCYEINIWDLNPNQEYRTGAIVTRSNPLAKVQTINKWNNYKIKVEKNRIQVWLNGILTADLENNDLQEGYIGLQAEKTGEVRFRNVKIKALK